MTKEQIINKAIELEFGSGNAKSIRAHNSSLVKVAEHLYDLMHPSLPSNLDEAAEKIACDIAPNHPDISWDNCFEKIKEGIKAGAEWMQNYIMSKTFEDEPLDSASRDVFREWIPMELLSIEGQDDQIPLYNQGALIMMFHAGAKWMKEQGVTLEGRVCKDDYAAETPFYYVETENSDDLPPVGDKVVVQIRKE